MIARALVSKPSLVRTEAMESRPFKILSIGKSSPISPVEQTITSPAETLSSAPTCSAVVCVSANPCGPVQAFAPPLLRTTARTTPPFDTWRDQITGAATTLLLVKTAAESKLGPRFCMRVRSSAPVLFKPAATEPDTKPFGKFMRQCHLVQDHLFLIARKSN